MTPRGIRSSLRRFIVSTLRVGFGFGGERYERFFAEALAKTSEVLYEKIETVPTARGTIKFYCLGDISFCRANSLLTKEPETIEWIDRFKDGDVYWDIGANVGIYALYAAINQKTRVLAFEPAAANYFLLNRNIELNGMADTVKAFCIAFSDSTVLDVLNMATTGLGDSLSSFGSTVDYHGEQFVPHFKQGMVAFSIDDFLARFPVPFPNHIKIDVDGIEDRIVVGAQDTLADKRLKSVSIELDAARPEYTNGVSTRLLASGLSLYAKRNSEMMRKGKYKDVFNYQFIRG